MDKNRDLIHWWIMVSLFVHVYIAVLITVGFLAYFT